MRFLSIIAVCLSLLPNISASQDAVVVELFTSQGCSSCPPADQLVRDLARQHDDIIVLGWHVDYWDYLGWKDEFSSPAYTARQAGYRDHWRLRSLYTPQIVVHGRDEMVGSNTQKVMSAIADVRTNMQMLSMVVTPRGGLVDVLVTPLESNLLGSEILLIKVLPRAAIDILRGENAGKQIEYINTVRNVSVISQWDSRSPVTVNGIDPAAGPYVLLIQARGYGPILGAQMLR